MKLATCEVFPGEEFAVTLEVENAEPFVAFQADIPLPGNFSYVNGSAQLNGARTNGHLLNASVVSGNVLRLIAYSIGNSPFSGNSGVIAGFSLKAGKNPGTFPLLLDNALLGNSQSQNILTGTQDGSIRLVAPDIVLSAASLDWGRVALQSSPSMNLQISNSGNSDLVINQLTFSDSQFSVQETTPLTLAPQTSRNIAIRFAPTAKGVVSKQLTVTSDDPDQSSLTVSLHAIAYAVNELHTGTVTGASNSTQTLGFSVNNMEPFTGFQFDVNLPQVMTYIDNSAVLFRKVGHLVSVNKVSDHRLRVLAFSMGNAFFTGNEGKIIDLDFALQGVAGSYPVSIDNVILVDASGENIVSDTYNGTLQIFSPDIAAGNRLDFGDVSILTGKELKHRIYNYGQESLNITQLLFSNNYFTTTQALPLAILPYQYADIPLLFAKNANGAETGVLKIFSNDPDENPFSVQLSANAYTPNILKALSQSMTVEETGAEIEIAIENEEDFVAFQFELSYPAGLTPNLAGIVLSERKQDHTFSANIVSNGLLRIVVFSITQKTFSGKSGAVLKIPFTVESTLPAGSYALSCGNALISNAQSENVLWNTEGGILTISKAGQTIAEEIPVENISIYPNPVRNELFIKSVTPVEKVTIYDITGVLVMYQQSLNGQSVDVSHLPDGVYFIRIENYTGKFVKK